MTRRRLAIVAVNVVLFCVFAELLSLFAYYVDTGRLYYVHHKTYESIPEAQDARRLTLEALHPYFGPTHTPGAPFDIPADLREDRTAVRLRTNNTGFVSPYDFPFPRRNERQFIVGIFGGSVAVWFCQAGAPRLVRDLQRAEFLQHREVIPLCFSHEGYKQPQQALVLAYFLSVGQPFDLVINIDGFNEVALGSLNDARGTDISMPSVQHLGPLIDLVNEATLTPEKLQVLARIARDRGSLNRLAAMLPRIPSSAIHFGYDRYYAWLLNAYHRELGEFDRLPSNLSATSLIQVTSRLRDRRGGVLFDDIARGWASASALMHDMLSARGVPYFHVLQPNQYYSIRRFSDAEAKVALNAESPYKRAAELGYPILLRKGEGLRKTEHFYSAVHLLDDEPGPVYRDNCCHYTLRGYQKLADFIAESVLTARAR